MGNRTRKPDEKSSKQRKKLRIKKESIRQLDTVTDDELRGVAGGLGTGGGDEPLPSRMVITC